MASLLGFAGILGLSQLAMAQDPVYFADANLKAAVESALGISDPTPTDMLSLTILTATWSEISDLTGIEYATNLTYLRLIFTQVSELSPLSGFSSLTELDLDSNQINDITGLSGLTSLEFLSLGNNQVSNISALSELTWQIPSHRKYTLIPSMYRLKNNISSFGKTEEMQRTRTLTGALSLTLIFTVNG